MKLRIRICCCLGLVGFGFVVSGALAKSGNANVPAAASAIWEGGGLSGFDGVKFTDSVIVDWVQPTRGVAIAVDAADNVYTIDSVSALGAEMILTKRDVSGAFVWETSFDQTDPTKWERASWVATDSGGNIIVCGTYMSGYSNPVEAASIVMKFDPDGKLLWRNVYENSFDGSSTKKCLIDASDNIYVLGMGSGPAGFVTKVKKFAPNGTAQWSYFDSAGIGAAVNFKFTPDGFIAITARSIFGSVNGYAKIDLGGNEVWSYPGVFSVTVGDCDGDAFGNTYLVHGEFVSNGGTVVKKVDPSGALIWENVYGLAGTRVEVGSDNKAVVSGFPNANTAGAAFIKIDGNGDLLWANLDADGPLGLLLHAQMLLDGANNAYLAAGTLFEMAVCKVNSDGTSAWTQTLPGSYANAIVLGANDHSVFVVGGTTARINQGAPPTPTPTPAPTPAQINISGTISYCSNPVPGLMPNVTLALTGTMGGSTVSDGSGNYTFSSLPSGGNYTVTPAKTALAPASPGIDTVDAIATQRHFLVLGTPLSGCRSAAADVTGGGGINTADVIAIQRFFLALTTGIGNAGKYQFTPVNRSYFGLVSNQTGQNYHALVFGDVAAGFVHRLEDGEDMRAGEVSSTVAAVALPEVAADQLRKPSRVQSESNFIAAVKTTAIDPKNRLVGFQGDFTFDERVVIFQSEPVQKAGLTAGNWNVSGNVLPGSGPIRTLRISAYSNDFTPLLGTGALFELRMTLVSKAVQRTQLIWAAPPDEFLFIDAELNTQKPGRSATGSVGYVVGN